MCVMTARSGFVFFIERGSMRRTRSLGPIVIIVAGFLGCDSSTANKEQRITLLVESEAVTLSQGQSDALLITIERTNFDQPVTLAVQGGLPQGVTATFANNPLPTGTSSTTLTLAAAGNAALGVAALTVRATGEGITEQSLPLQVTVTVTGTYTLGLLNSAVTIAQGGGGSATVLLTRSGGNAGDVSLSASGLPAGVSATFAQSTTTDRAASLTVVATANAVAGTYPITIGSSSPGLTPDQSTSLSVVVIPPPSTASVTVPFCSTDVPVWFAFQNEGYAWQQATATGNNFTFSATERLGIAFVFATGQQSEASIYYVTRAEIEAFDDRDCAGPKTLTGTVAGLSTGESALVVMGASSDLPSASALAYSLEGVAARPLDLVATRGIVINDAYLTPDRIVVRRGVDLATGSSIPPIDFTAAEAFAPAQTTLTVSGAGVGEDVILQNVLLTATSTYGTMHVASPSGTTATLRSAPAAQMIATDLHEFFLDASASNGLAGRAYVDYTGAPVDRTVTLGPALSTPTMTVVSTTPYVRVRAAMTAQADYSTVARFTLLQGTFAARKFVVPIVTAAYLGALPTTWEVVVPDFTGTPGFNPAWMLVASENTPYVAEAFSGRNTLLFGGVAVGGDAYRLAYHQSSVATAARIRGSARLPRLGRVPQYLRR
jgi:hypothetical protein